VQADALGRDPDDGPVDGVDVELDHLQKALERVPPEEARAFHGEVRAVHLQDQAAGVDQLVLLSHLAAESHDVLLVRGVVGGEQDGGDHPGGGRGHEALDEPARPGVGLAQESVALAGRRPEIRVLDLGDRLRRVADAGRVAPPPGQHLGVVGEVDEVLGQLAPARAPEALHAPRHVGGEAGARLLAVVADVDAGLELPGDDT
jgi:hypothetical protein